MSRFSHRDLRLDCGQRPTGQEDPTTCHLAMQFCRHVRASQISIVARLFQEWDSPQSMCPRGILPGRLSGIDVPRPCRMYESHLSADAANVPGRGAVQHNRTRTLMALKFTCPTVSRAPCSLLHGASACGLKSLQRAGESADVLLGRHTFVSKYRDFNSDSCWWQNNVTAVTQWCHAVTLLQAFELRVGPWPSISTHLPKFRAVPWR